ncbi:MAG TPA: hypothetical protein PLI53_00755 [Geobacteraceae bacterium]|nr:hypothetical protein [Geobacteraceae bacterium]
MSRFFACCLFALLLAGVLNPVSSWASSAGNVGPRGMERRKGPPPEAVAACSGKSEGTTVEFTTPHGDKLTGVCRKIDDTLAAVPKGMGSGHPPRHSSSSE